MGRELTQRVRQANGNGEVAERPQGPVTLAEKIRGMESQFKMAMPRGAEAVQLIRDALTCLRTTRNLDKCTHDSVLGGLMTCAQLGLRPGVLGHAWLIPFYDSRSKGYKATLVIGYQGMVDLAHRSGKIASLIARTVYANDTFDVDYGLSDRLIHRPILTGARGEAIAYYAIAKFTTGGHAFIVMSHAEMEEYRDHYATARNREGKIVGPWVDNFEGMAHKTCVRQLSKWMPKSTELASAIAADETVRIDLSTDPDAILHGSRGDVIDGEYEETNIETDGDELPVEDSPADLMEAAGEQSPMALAGQLRQIGIALTDAGVTTREHRLIVLSELAGDRLTSSKDLSRHEAGRLLDRIGAMSLDGSLAPLIDRTRPTNPAAEPTEE